MLLNCDADNRLDNLLVPFGGGKLGFVNEIVVVRGILLDDVLLEDLVVEDTLFEDLLEDLVVEDTLLKDLLEDLVVEDTLLEDLLEDLVVDDTLLEDLVDEALLDNRVDEDNLVVFGTREDGSVKGFTVVVRFQAGAPKEPFIKTMRRKKTNFCILRYTSTWWDHH
jgi:hypothetical protein